MLLVAVVLPADPLIQTGSTLRMTCSIPDRYDGPCDSSDISFMLDQQIYNDSTHGTIIDHTMAELVIEDVTRDMSGKHVYCIPPADSGLVTGEQILTVAGRMIPIYFPHLQWSGIYYNTETCDMYG